MSFMSVTPEALTAAAHAAHSIENLMSHGNARAVPALTGVHAPGHDVVSALAAKRFAAHAAQYQEISTEALAILRTAAAALSSAAGSYSHTEATNAKHVG
ncbi:hypothetical protein B586_15110 [Mycobacterium haemophilum DSM 44634]|uniref:PE family protein n=1 Tax=Mycobacterium haemophilum TaxID=29311 RepID=UPI0006558015|nr:PE family protein [Mycobacterium haemophilum]AKN17606.1 hypothetical protein B586_15110 [Mycobacterium haemophilum DSM 44634]MCV7341763.1 PE family protein [Mycobacterium haemophilum DSM 44634]